MATQPATQTDNVKTTVTKTVTEEQTLCDHCGKLVIYSEQACIVCGKCACHECFHKNLIELELGKFPKFWPPLESLPGFHAYACVDCSNKLTRRFIAVKSKTERHNEQCKRWHAWYLEQIKILNEWKDKAEKNAL